MRPGQNKRMRGRNNNGGNRKGPNPLTRSYESNGPDVKIRGTAQHIGEKYLQLARDAQTSGDPVAAESYLQHAEHYFRLIAAAQQAQFQAQNGYARQPGEADADEGDEDDDLVAPDRFALPSERVQPQPQAQGQAQPYPPQPQQGYGDRPNGNGAAPGNGYAEQGERQPRPQEGGGDRPYRSDRQEGGDRPYRNDRNAYDNRGNYNDRQNQYDRNGDRNQYRNDRQDRNDRNNNRPRYGRDDREFRDANRDNRDNGRDYQNNRDNRGDRDSRGDRDNRDPQYRDQPRIAPTREAPYEQRPLAAAAPIEPAGELPAFITAPVRTAPPIEAAPAEPAMVTVPETSEAPVEAQADDVALRPRRRRRPRVAAVEPGEPSSEAPSAEG